MIKQRHRKSSLCLVIIFSFPFSCPFILKMKLLSGNLTQKHRQSLTLNSFLKRENSYWREEISRLYLRF